MTKLSSKYLERLDLDDLEKYFESEELTIEILEEKLPIDKILNKFDTIEDENLLREISQQKTGVLLSDEIKYYAEKFKLIWPFNEESLKQASYQLRVGNEYVKNKKKHKLNNKEDVISIPPFEVVIIKTKEILNLPRFLIGRWNIRVKNAYEGLIWVGGPQVDPGWLGHLFCPIYNLSNEEVTLERGEKLATIDFIRTTTFNKENNDVKKYKFNRLPKRMKIEDYNKFDSGLAKDVKERIDSIEGKVGRVESVIGLVFTILAVLFATLSVFVTTGEDMVRKSLPVWVYLSVGLSVAAIAISLFSRTRIATDKWFKTIVFGWLGLLTVLLVVIFGWINVW